MATPTFCCGAECGASFSGSGTHWQNTPTGGSFDTGTVRSGLRSLRLNLSGAAGAFNGNSAIAGAGTTDWVVRFYVRFATLPSATSAVVATENSYGVYFKASDSSLYVGSSTIVLGLTGVAITSGQWYRVDLKMTATTLDAQVDGVAVGQLVGVYAVSQRIDVGSVATATTRDQFTDDIITSNTLADYPIGAGYILSYIPNADGTHNVAGANDFERTLTGTDITNSTTDAYTLIDERPLPTTAVDFINGVAPPNSTDYVEWQYEDSVESEAPRTVEAIIIHHDAGGAGTNNFTVTLRESAGATSGDIWTGTTNVGGTITPKRAHFATVPGTSDAWTTTTFNNLRSRFLVSDASPDPYIDAAMLEVDFPPGVERVPRFTSYPQLLAH